MSIIEGIGILIFTIIYTVLQVIAISLYFNGFMMLKINKMSFYFLAFGFTGMIKFLPADMNAVAHLLIFLLFLGFTILVSFQGSVSQKIYHAFYFTLINTLTDLVLSIIVKDLVIASYMMLVVSFIANFISLFIVLLAIKILVYFSADIDVELSTSEYILLCIIPCLSLIIVYLVTQLEPLGQFISCLFILIINICVTIIYNTLLRKKCILYKYSMIEAQNTLYKETLSNQKELNLLKHDLKNILVNFAYCLENKQVQQVEKQLQEILNSSAFSSKSFTGYLPLDAILHSKLEDIQQHNIDCDMDLQVPTDIKFKNDVDIVAIVGNILDNAIEAVLRLPENTKKKINISFKFHEEKLFINIINSSNPINLPATKQLLFSEKRKNDYGIGISSIKERVIKLNGYYDFSYNEGLFHVMIVLPVQN